MSRRVWLVRHGEPTEATGVDPGLSELGRQQAATLPAKFASLTTADAVAASVALCTSPLRRARETAAPLEAAWSTDARIDDTFRELPSNHANLDERRTFLRRAMAGTFLELDDLQRDWRAGIIAGLRALAVDTVITTHAVVINAVTSFAEGHDSVLAWIPAHASITVIDIAEDSTVSLIERGEGRPNSSFI